MVKNDEVPLVSEWVKDSVCRKQLNKPGDKR